MVGALCDHRGHSAHRRESAQAHGVGVHRRATPPPPRSMGSEAAGSWLTAPTHHHSPTTTHRPHLITPRPIPSHPVPPYPIPDNPGQSRAIPPRSIPSHPILPLSIPPRPIPSRSIPNPAPKLQPFHHSLSTSFARLRTSGTSCGMSIPPSHPNLRIVRHICLRIWRSSFSPVPGALSARKFLLSTIQCSPCGSMQYAKARR